MCGVESVRNKHKQVSDDKMEWSSEKKKVLFICIGNAARSQMAEGLLRELYGERYDVYSAGTNPAKGVTPYAVRALAELDIDISGQRSKSVEEFKEEKFDYVVTLCDRARESCPSLPKSKEYLHRNFEDPYWLSGSKEEILTGFRRIRGEIGDWIKGNF